MAVQVDEDLVGKSVISRVFPPKAVRKFARVLSARSNSVHVGHNGSLVQKGISLLMMELPTVGTDFQ